ncbi:MAG: rRNA pseudouridine synthase [Anaerohalosphaera sp.]|nr:rRNA pseudouridine synthase [Anaerohalosphaera sp.]
MAIKRPNKAPAKAKASTRSKTKAVPIGVKKTAAYKPKLTPADIAKAKAIRKRKRKTKPSEAPAGMMRLQKVLAAAGIDSRRNCEELILSGVVCVNRKVVDQLPAFVDPEKDTITVDGKSIKRVEKVYFLLNKPKGYICTNSDPYGRKKAIDLVDTELRVFCVGRLDADTTGAIILTNDSELTNRLTHPSYELPKTYEVTIDGSIDGEAIEKMKKGTWLAEGRTGRAAVKVLHRSHTSSTIQVVIRQGLNRQIRRIVARVGFKVRSLKRTKIGNVDVKGMRLGQCKRLTHSQVAYLMKETSSPKKQSQE